MICLIGVYYPLDLCVIDLFQFDCHVWLKSQHQITYFLTQLPVIYSPSSAQKHTHSILSHSLTKTCIHFRVDPSADMEATHTHANISTCTCNKNTKGNSQLLSCSLGHNLSEATAQFIWSIVPWVKGRTLTFPSDRAVGRIMTQTEDHRLPQLMVKDMKQRRSNPQSCLTLTLFFFVEMSHDYRYSFWVSVRLFLTKSQVPGLIQR